MDLNDAFGRGILCHQIGHVNWRLPVMNFRANAANHPLVGLVKALLHAGVTICDFDTPPSTGSTGFKGVNAADRPATAPPATSWPRPRACILGRRSALTRRWAIRF